MQFVSQRRISLEDREASRLEVRLDGERRRYADQKRLPSEVISLHPQEDPAGVAMGVDEDHASIWIAEVRTKPGPASQAHAAQPALAVDLTANTKTNVNAKTTETKAIMRVRIPQTYPFQGPIVSFKGREVRFVMGAAAMQHDACPSILHATWTPAQSILDAVVATADLVRRAEIEDHLDFTSSPRPQA